MISHEHKCIFIHIPKCAGTSIEKSLSHFVDYSGRERQDHRSLRMIEPINSNIFASGENFTEFTKRFLKGFTPQPNPRNRYTVSRMQYESYFKFTIVRNPWARAYSWYKNVLRDFLHRKNYKISDNITFSEFLMYHVGKKCLRPQTFWIKNYKGEIPFDYIGRFENLANDFEKVCNLMNIPPIKLPHELKGSLNNYLEAYDDKSRDIIKNAYSEEIELFGYSFYPKNGS